MISSTNVTELMDSKIFVPYGVSSPIDLNILAKTNFKILKCSGKQTWQVLEFKLNELDQVLIDTTSLHLTVVCEENEGVGMSKNGNFRVLGESTPFRIIGISEINSEVETYLWALVWMKNNFYLLLSDIYFDEEQEDGEQKGNKTVARIHEDYVDSSCESEFHTRISTPPLGWDNILLSTPSKFEVGQCQNDSKELETSAEIGENLLTKASGILGRTTESLGDALHAVEDFSKEVITKTAEVQNS